MSLLDVSRLTVGVEHSPLNILRDVSFSVDAGEVLGLVGESGSGKTMASLAIMGLLPLGIEMRSGSVGEGVCPSTQRMRKVCTDISQSAGMP